MLKHFAAAAIGFAVVFGAIGPAAADKGGKVWVGKPLYSHTYPYTAKTGQPKSYATTKRKKKFDPNLDFETEAVWRNLRPEWFD